TASVAYGAAPLVSVMIDTWSIAVVQFSFALFHKANRSPVPRPWYASPASISTLRTVTSHPSTVIVPSTRMFWYTCPFRDRVMSPLTSVSLPVAPVFAGVGQLDGVFFGAAGITAPAAWVGAIVPAIDPVARGAVVAGVGVSTATD